MNRFLLRVILVIVTSTAGHQLFGQLQTIDFEAATGYTTTEFQTGGAPGLNEYWKRFNKANEEALAGTDDHDLASAVTGVQGNFYFASEHINGGPGNLERTLITDALNVTASNSLEVRLLVAATGSGYDAAQDYLIIEYTYNGSTFTKIGQFSGSAGGSFRVDTNMDGDGAAETALTSALTEYTFAIPKAGTSLQVRIRGYSSAQDEEIIFDNVRIYGTADATAPTLAITRNAVTLGSHAGTTDASISFNLAFSEVLASASISATADVAITNPGGVTYTAIAAGNLTTTDNQNYTFTISGISAGNGALSITVGPTITDIAGNAMAAAEGPSATIVIDNDAPAFSGTAPAASALVANTVVSYSLSEALASGTITWTGTAGPDNGTVHAQTLSAGERTIGAHNSITLSSPPTLVSNSTYTITFNGTDAAGNAATTVTVTGVYFDNTAPVFSSTAPATSALVNSTVVSYTLSEAIASGTITWTGTAGPDNGNSHAQTLSAGERTTGAHNGITLSSPPTLLDGSTYTITFNGSDATGNTATTVTNTGIVYDATAPVFSATAPAASALVANTVVSYTLSEALASGTITWTGTAGPDNGTVHAQTLSAGERTMGAHNSITLSSPPTLVSNSTYTITFNGSDAAGNAATTVTVTGVYFDNTAPVFSSTAPATGTSVNSTVVSYTLSEAIASGTITWTGTAGPDNGNSHAQTLSAGERTTGAHNGITLSSPPTLVNGSTYTITFNGADATGNNATTVTNTGIVYDVTAPAFSGTAPAASSFVNNSVVSYTLSEALASGTITWTGTAGPDNGNSHAQTLSAGERTSGAHNGITLSSPPTLVSNSTYTITFNGSDAAGNAATTVTVTGVVYDATAPVFSATAPASSSFVNSTVVSYTLSEAIASGTITWTGTAGPDNGNSHAQTLSAAERTTGAHNGITLSSPPTLLDGSTYTITFNGTDAAGNNATTVTNTGIYYDVTAPVFSGTAPATSAIVTNSVVSYTLSEALVSGTITWTGTAGADNGNVHAQTLSAGERTSGAHNGITLSSAPALVSPSTYTITFNGADAAGNAATTVTATGVQYDVTPPTVTINRVTATPSKLTSIDFDVTFNEPVTGVDIADFLLETGNANDATGSLSLTPNSSTNYTVHVTSVVGQNVGGVLSVLNLDIQPAATGIQDQAGNAFANGITEQEYEVDNTPPALSPDQMLLKDNGTLAETITFTLNEKLAVADGGSVLSGFSTTPATVIASAIYSDATNKITLTSNGDGQWTSATTISYNGAGAFTDIIGNLLPVITNHVVIQPVVNLVAGDVMFTSFRADDNDQFSMVILRNIPVNTQIYFTDRGWKATGTPGFEDFTNDGLFIWTATSAVTAGTEIKFIASSNNFSSSIGSVANDADQVKMEFAGDAMLAYQTDGSTITFLGAIKFGDGNGWVGDNDPDNSNESAVPAGLTASHYLLAGNFDDGAYNRTAAAATFTGSATEIRTLLLNTGNWDRDDDPNNVDLPGNPAPNDATAWAGFNPGGVNYVIRHKINSVSIPNVAMKVGSVVTATINVDDDASLTPSTLTGGTIGGFTLGSLNRTNATTYTAQFTVAEGGTDVAAGSDIPVASLVLQNSLGNSHPAFAANVNPAGNADAIDAKSPRVASLVRQSTTTSQFGTSATSVVFRMSFVSAGTSTPEDIQISTLTAADFSIPVTGSVTGAAVTNVAPVSTGVYDITVGNYSGTGTLGLNYRDSEVNAMGASVLDMAGNTTITSSGVPDGSLTGEVYAIVLPEPGPGGVAIPVTVNAFSSNSVTIEWPSDGTTPLPTHYLVLARLTSAGAPVMGTDVADFTYINDGAMVQNVARIVGTHSATFSGLASGTSYSFYVIKYALSASNTTNHIDFQYTNFGSATQVTSTAELSWIQSTAAPITIESIKTSSGNSASVMSFTIFDDGQDPLASSIMALHANGSAPETITFTLRDKLTVGDGGSITGFQSSNGTIASAIYTEQGTTYEITLTNTTNGTWNAATLISYNAVSGTAVFNSLGRMQSIDSHPVVQDVVNTYSVDGTFVVPAGVTSITVEVWGGGGSGGEYSTGYSPNGGSGGGGGGAYSRSVLSVTPGDNFNFTIGQGGAARAPLPCCNFGNNGGTTSFAGLVVAEGGYSGAPSAWHGFYGPVFAHPPDGQGGRAIAGVGDVRFDGGFGGFGQSGLSTSGGGGGSAGGPFSSGFQGSFGGFCAGCTVSGASSPGDSGTGGYGAEGFAGGTGGFPGGGGGGVGTGLLSGAGANGRVRVSYTPAGNSGTPDWAADNSPFKFSQLVITRGTTGNSPELNNWQDIILGAQLSDGTPATPATGTVNTNNITFSAIPSNLGEVGYIDDATTGPSSKTYTLKIWLRTDLNNTLAPIVDGKSLSFKLDPTSIVYNDGGSQSSRFVTPVATYIPVFESGTNPIEVTATKFAFDQPGNTSLPTQPQGQIGVSTLFSASSSPQPVVYALDINDNLDTDYANDVDVKNPTFLPALVTRTFSAGVLSLGNFAFTTGSPIVAPVNTQITVEDPDDPSNLTIASTDVAPVISNLTTIVSGSTAEPGFFLSTNTTQASAVQNFDFRLNEDFGASTTSYDNNDALPTILTNVSFTQHTDNGAVSGGGDPDFDLWLKSIGGAELTRTGVSGISVLASRTNTSLDFDLTSLTPAQITSFATITDGGNATFNLKVWLLNPVDASLRQIIDGLDLVFNVGNGSLQVAGSSLSSHIAAGNINSGNGNNQIEVDATRLVFTQDFSGALSVVPPMPPVASSGIDFLVNTSTTTLGLLNPVVEAVDVNGLLDTEYTAAITTSNAGLIGMTNPLTGLTNGTGTFPGGFLYTAIGNGTLTATTALGNRTGFVPTATSNGQSINVRTGNASTIDAPSTVISSPITSITNTSPGFTVFKFRVDDDPAGTPVSEDDGNPTLITALTFNNVAANNIVDWTQAIAGARLEDAGNASKFVDLNPATQIGATTLIFTGIPITAGELGYIDNGNTKEYNLKIWLKTNLTGTQTYDRLIDGLKFGFDLITTNVSTDINGTSLLAGQQANGANGATTVSVTATQIDFVEPIDPVGPTTASASLEVPLQVIVEARDVNGNLDTGFNSTIIDITNAAGATMQSPKGFTIDTGGSDITFGATQFAGGIYNFPYTVSNGFQFTSGTDNADVSLTVNAGTISTLGTPGPKYPEIRLATSFESYLEVDPGFTPVTLIPYIDHQNIASASTSFAVAQFRLVDGDGAIGDGAATNIQDLTLSVTNPENIKHLALYKGTTHVQTKDNIDFAGGSVTFDNLSGQITTGTDNANLVFTVRASFYDSPAEITDNAPIQLSVTAVTQNGGSKFLGTKPSALDPLKIGGINGGNILTADVGAEGATHNVDVVATSLDFTTQASTFAGINEPIGPTYTTPPLPSTSAAFVRARDKFAVIDVDFDYPATVTGTSAGVDNSTGFVFTDGELDLDGMEYTSAGNGTLNVAANGLNSSTVPADNIGNHISGQLVNVLHVAATYPSTLVLQPQVGTVPPTAAIKGGSTNLNIFGVTFTAQNPIGSHPVLTRFTFSFDIDYTNIFQGFVVREVIGSNSTDITGPTIQGTITPTSPTTITIDFSANPRPLYSGPITYILYADVNAGASISTPIITPRFDDLGWFNPADPTDKNTVVSRGTATGSFAGNAYTFASTKPPLLRTAKSSQTRPYAGQLNVDPDLPSILLDFDTDVTSLDGGLNNGAELYRRSDNKKVADLIAPLGSGNYLTPHPLNPPAKLYDYEDVKNPLEFDIAFIDDGNGNLEEFEADEVYYVAIKQGSFDPLAPAPTGGTGISDRGLNFFGGISSNSTLYFKISSDKPLLLSAVEGKIHNQEIVSIATTFDQFGTAYVLVLPEGATPPTQAQVKSPATYLGVKIAETSYEITQINVPQTASFAAILSPGFVYNDTYDVYIYAENDAQPIPVESGGVYGPDLIAGSVGGPTLQITAPGSADTANPNYQICPNSFVLATEPIVLSETAKTGLGSFNMAGAQDFNILLPTGYSFDLESFPTVQLIGADFGGIPPTLSYQSNSVLNISYTNTTVGLGSLDHIVINNLRVSGAAGSNPSSILRFYGTNTFSSATAPIAGISLYSDFEFDFDNTYNRDNRIYFPAISELPNGTAIPDVNAIPDNYIDDELGTGGIRLLPKIATPNDYNASIFTGTGVTNDKLTLSAVATNSAFNITMNHVDPNGCVVQVTEQYLVYDHVSPISKKLGKAFIGTALEGSAQALVNTSFPGISPAIVSSPDSLYYNEVAGYRVLGLTADLPARVLKSELEGIKTQIMTGPYWRAQVKKIPNAPRPVGVPPFGNFYNYAWDYARILNADTEQPIGAITVNPYNGDNDNRFDAVTTNQNTYWKGGSLGFVEFTGVLQSSADLQVTIPFRQEVEIFVPAIPLIEVSSASNPRFDNDDQTANNFDATVPKDHINLFQYPTDGNNNSLYPGTTLFCEANGTITLNGYPAALSGTSVGTFAIYDYKSYDFSSSSNVPLLASATGTAFVDNLNGTATLDPTNAVVKNNYDDVLISYTYQQNNSPAQGVGYLIIRVVPNPLAKIVTSSLKTSASLYTGSDFCEGIPITFDGTGSSLATGGKTGSIDTHTWNFGDGGADVTGVTQTHTYENSLIYPASLKVTSTYGCESTTEVAPLRIGSIPDAEFTFLGVSTADDISFTNASTLASSATVNDGFDVLHWSFDFTNPSGTTLSVSTNFNAPVTNGYATAGVYTVNLNVSSKLGCANEISHDIIVLSREDVTDIDAYEERFEGGDGEWQTNALRNTTTTWAYGAPGKAVITLAPENGSNIWVTSLTGFYDPNEKSALYSPSFNLSSLERPMISFDHFTHLAAGEGVAVEYSIDNKNVADPSKEWIVLGTVNPTLGWYNANGLSSQPGLRNFEGFGWSSEDTEWSESKYVLDDVLNEPNVVFRFALSTLTDSPNKDGFAVDNVRVGNRTRTVLVENFKNLGNTAQTGAGRVIEEQESEELRTFKDGAIGTKLVKVNYHVGFPQLDPFNSDNPQDPSSRALYYNIKATPVVKMDGEGEEGLFSEWGENKYDVQTLKLANARIDIDVNTNLDGSLTASATITAISKVLPEQSTILHVAVVENSIDLTNLPQNMRDLIRTGESRAYFVMKKMLPSATGTRFTRTLADGDSDTYSGFSWTPDRTRLYSTDNLAVIVFVQDELTKEVYQAEVRDLGQDPPAVTGLENGLRIEDVILHPNPADDELTVRLPRNAVADVDIQMIDQAGRSLQRATLKEGERSTTLNVRDLPGAVYLLKLTENGRVTYKRAMVVHRN